MRAKDKDSHNVTLSEEMSDASLVMFMWYITLNVLLFISAALYLRIRKDIGTFSNLRSVVDNQPQKYIFYQTFTIVLVKTCCFLFTPAAVYLLNSWYSIISFIEQAATLCALMDIFSTPVIVQISYLTCNKRNVDAIFRILNESVCKRMCNPEMEHFTSAAVCECTFRFELSLRLESDKFLPALAKKPTSNSSKSSNHQPVLIV
ncbi:unnamed protein product [Caenorhabditis sp. 36 PRJEB53466]|nr:unnamed protein product [Caenorhabditis sp. 36 PRJEB53466]